VRRGGRKLVIQATEGGFVSVLAVADVDDRAIDIFLPRQRWRAGSSRAPWADCWRSPPIGDAIVEGGIVAAGSAIEFSRKKRARGAGVARVVQRVTPPSGLPRRIGVSARVSPGWIESRIWVAARFILVYKLIGEAGDADGL